MTSRRGKRTRYQHTHGSALNIQMYKSKAKLAR